MAEILVDAVENEPVSGIFDPDEECMAYDCDGNLHPKMKRVVCFKVDEYLPGDVLYLEFDRRL